MLFWIKNDGKNNPSVLRDLSATNNIFFAKDQTQFPARMATAFNDIQSFGIVDSNTYVRPTDDNQLITGQLLGDPTTTTYYTLPEWQSYSGFDAHSIGLPLKISTYQVNGLIGSNLYPNGQFTTNKNNFQVWSPTGNTMLAWDGTNKITGAGSVKIIPQVSKTDYALITGSLSTVVPVSPSKNYLLRFTTIGTTEKGLLRVHLRRMGAPYTSLTPLQTASFGTAKKTHEFLFTAPTANDAATFVIQLREDSGVTYIDDIEFHEANVTVLNDQFRFEYNASDLSKTISLDTTYTDINNKPYAGSVTLAPWTSIILIKKAAIFPTQ